jgi:hypothetical protein
MVTPFFHNPGSAPWLCKNVVSKLWRRIDKEGHQIIPILSSWWKRNENSSFKGKPLIKALKDVRAYNIHSFTIGYLMLIELMAIHHFVPLS